MSLVEVRVRHLAVFEDGLLPFGPGFTALTGETGSGKSVCVTALRLALGDRVDGDPVRPGAGAAQVSAVFDDLPGTVRERLEGLGVPADDLATLTREVSSAGRSSCRVNGALVSQAVLREVGEALAEVTRQGASGRLLLGARQRDLLDLAAGTAALRDDVRRAVGAWREATAALEELRRRQAAGAAELDAARQVVADLDDLALREGEDDELAAERLRLRNAGTLADAFSGLHGAAAGDDDVAGAADLLARAVEAAGGVDGVDPGLDSLREDAAGIVERLRDLAAVARRHRDAIALDADRLSAVEERLDVLARVRRRHGSVGAALEALAAARDLLESATDGGARVAQAQVVVDERRDAAGLLASELSQRRHRAARRLQTDVEAALHRLELPHARLRIVLERSADPDGVEVDGARVRCGPAGIDDVELRLSTNRGVAPVPLGEGPSGGELSRLMLAISACVTESGSPLLVLDEVDSGIGGETAARVGDLLAATGRHRQVVAVTHRAEIASRADAHLVVRKTDTARGPTARVDAVSGDERLAEIARLMSGRVTDAALARAMELRGEAVDTIAAQTAPLRSRQSRRHG